MVQNNNIEYEEIEDSNKVQETSIAGNHLPTKEKLDAMLEKEYAGKLFDDAVRALQSNPELLHEVLAENNAKSYVFEHTLTTLIKNYGTPGTDGWEFNQMANLLRLHSEVKSISASNHSLKISLADGTEIKSSLLSESANINAEQLAEFQNNYSNEQSALLVAMMLKTPSRIVIGKTGNLSSKSAQIHTWVEASPNGKDWVYDMSLNAIINKQGYYRLRHAEPVSVIPFSTVKEDLAKLNPYIKNGKISLKEYLIFRDDVMELLSEQCE